MENLENLTLNELEDLRADKIQNLGGIINLCKKLGNKDYKNNVLVKDLMQKIELIDNKIKELKN